MADSDYHLDENRQLIDDYGEPVTELPNRNDVQPEREPLESEAT